MAVIRDRDRDRDRGRDRVRVRVPCPLAETVTGTGTVGNRACDADTNDKKLVLKHALADRSLDKIS